MAAASYATTWMSPHPGYESVNSVAPTYGGLSYTQNLANNMFGMSLGDYQARNRQMLDPNSAFWQQFTGSFNTPYQYQNPANSATQAFINQYRLNTNNPVQANLSSFTAQSPVDWINANGGMGSQVTGPANEMWKNVQGQLGNMFSSLRQGVNGAFGPGVAGGSPILDAKYAADYAPWAAGILNGLQTAAYQGAANAAGAQNAWNANTRDVELNQFNNTRNLAAQMAGQMDSLYQNMYSGINQYLDRYNQYRLQAQQMAMQPFMSAWNANLQGVSTPDQQYASKTPLYSGRDSSTNYVGGGGGGGTGGDLGNTSMEDFYKNFQVWSDRNNNRNSATNQNYNPTSLGASAKAAYNNSQQKTG